MKNKVNVVSCKTEEEAKELLTFLEGEGYRRKVPVLKLTEATHWGAYKADTHYKLFDDKTILVGTSMSIEKRDVIMSSTEYLKQNRKPQKLVYETRYQRSDNVFFAETYISFDNTKMNIDSIQKEIEDNINRNIKLNGLLTAHKKLKF